MGEVTPLLGGMAEEQPQDAAALADALRFADALERDEAGLPVDLDPVEDPALAGLLGLAREMRAPIARATDAQSFRSFRQRSRAAVLHALEDGRVTTLRPRASRIWFSLAGAAAAAAISIALFSDQATSPTRGGENLTVASTSVELDRIGAALAAIQERSERGERVPAPLFQDVIEGSARISNLIEQRPDVISRQAVTAYAQAVQAGAQVLETAIASPGAGGALAAAQRATRDGAVVATRYLAAQASPTPTATPDGTPAPTPTPTTTPTATATPTATPAATATPTATATATSTPTATPTATPTGTPVPTATPDATPSPTPDDVIRR